jgi:hypothetical protein
MPELRNLIMGVVGWDDPTPPPAASAAMPKPKVLTLADRYNAQRQTRIITGRNVPLELSA